METYEAEKSLPKAKKQLPENTVWQCWLQGEEHAPEIVRKCLASVRKHTKGRLYVLITDENMHEYLDIPAYIIQKHDAGKIGHAHFSDLLRLMLLAQYGGTWIDATVLLTSPLPESIEKASFFAFKTIDFCLLPRIPLSLDSLYGLFPDDSPWTPVGNPFHCCSSWFIHASRNNPLIRKVLHALFEYWKRRDEILDYFIMHYFLTLAILTDDACRRLYVEMPSIGNYCPHVLQFSLKQRYRSEVFEEFCRMSFAHKLTYKIPQPEPSVDSFFNKILSC